MTKNVGKGNLLSFPPLLGSRRGKLRRESKRRPPYKVRGWIPASAGMTIIFLVLILNPNLLFGETGEEKKADWVVEIEKAFPPAEKCKQCHEMHYSQWKGSRFGSFLNEPLFKVVLGVWLKTNPLEEAKKACLSCHIPSMRFFPQHTEKVIDQILSGKIQIEGIGCSGCHLISSWSDIKNPPAEIDFKLGDLYFGPYDNAEENLAHKSGLIKGYSSSDYCTLCHYDKLQQASLPTGEMITREIVCQRCHMSSSVGMSAKGGPIRRIADHSFSGGLPPEFSGKMRANIMNEWLYKLDMAAEKKGDSLDLFAKIKAGEIAHTLPDGDPLFKEYILSIYVKDHEGREVYKGEKIFKRNFDEILKDTKIPVVDIPKTGETRRILFTFKVPETAKRLDIDLLLTYSLIPEPDSNLMDSYLSSLPAEEQDETRRLIADYRRSYTLAHLFKSY